MIRTDKRMRLCAALLICILAFIWGNSLLPGTVSGAFSDWIGDLLAGLMPGGGTETGGGLLRKAAHFTEFTALGMCLGWLAGMLGKKTVWPLLWGVAAACVDETIQRFVPGRCCSIKDVAIDSAGVLTGMILLCLGHAYFQRRSAKMSIANQSLEDM